MAEVSKESLSWSTAHPSSPTHFSLQFHPLLFLSLADKHPELSQNLRQARELRQEVSQGGWVGRGHKEAVRESWAGRSDRSITGRWSCPRTRDITWRSIDQLCPRFCPVCSPLARTVDLDEGVAGGAGGWGVAGGGILERAGREWRTNGKGQG